MCDHLNQVGRCQSQHLLLMAFTRLSPVSVNPVLSPPSKILPQRSWAASIPTLLSHDALNKLLSPCPLPQSSGAAAGAASVTTLCSPLERFLCCVYYLRHLKRVIPSVENVSDCAACNHRVQTIWRILEDIEWKVNEKCVLYFVLLLIVNSTLAIFPVQCGLVAAVSCAVHRARCADVQRREPAVQGGPQPHHTAILASQGHAHGR